MKTETDKGDSADSLVEIAVNGYMNDRHHLVKQLSEISCIYEREIERRKSIIREIERIDDILNKVFNAEGTGPSAKRGSVS